MSALKRVSVLLAGAAMSFAVALSLAAGPAPVSANETPSASPEAESDASAKQNAANEQVIDQIRQENEQVAEGTHFTYDPANRRDPFEPLIKTGPQERGPRPAGVKGMTVAELALKGVAVDPRGNSVAIVRGSDNRGYTLRVGDVIYDARVLSIEPKRGIVVFRQQVDDPRRIKPYRDVTKRLNLVPQQKQDQQNNEDAEGDSVEGA